MYGKQALWRRTQGTPGGPSNKKKVNLNIKFAYERLETGPESPTLMRHCNGSDYYRFSCFILFRPVVALLYDVLYTIFMLMELGGHFRESIEFSCKQNKNGTSF